MMKPWQAPLNKPPSKGGKEEGLRFVWVPNAIALSEICYLLV
jgi:hypothetical protein